MTNQWRIMGHQTSTITQNKKVNQRWSFYIDVFYSIFRCVCFLSTYYEKGAQLRMPAFDLDVMTATGLGATAEIPSP